MENSDLRPGSFPRQNLNRTLEYRSHVRWLYYAVLIAASIFLSLGIIFAFALLIKIMSKTSAIDSSLVNFTINNIVFGAICYLEARYLLKPLAFSKITVFPDKLNIELFSKRVELPFDAIQKVKCYFFPYFGGWFQIHMKNKKKYRFTVVLERSEYILEAISVYNPGLLPVEKLELYRRTAIVADHSWARLFDLKKGWPMGLVMFLGAPIFWSMLKAVLMKLKHHPPSLWATHELTYFVALTGISIVLGLFIYFIVDIYLVYKKRQQLIMNPNNVRRNTKFESKVIKIAVILHLLIFSTLALLTIIPSLR